MALTWTSKPAGAVYRLTWTIPIVEGDSVSTALLTVTDGDAAIDSYEVSGNDVIAFVSGGTAGTVTTIAASAVTDEGETLSDTIYLPIRDSASTAGNTAADVVTFALRPVAGMGNDSEAEEAEDALEVLNGMLNLWRIDGLDVGVPGQLALTDALLVQDEHLTALKYNLRVLVIVQYGGQPSPFDLQMAERSKMLVANSLFGFSDLAFESGLLQSRPLV